MIRLICDFRVTYLHYLLGQVLQLFVC